MQKIKILKLKKKKNLKVLSFYTFAPQMTIIWCMFLEIRGMTDIICHSGLFFAHLPPYGHRKSMFWKNENKPEDIITLQMCTINDSHMMYGSWYGVGLKFFFVILDRFLPFYPPNNPKDQDFEKMKKAPGDIIILHRCTINDNHMMYSSWDHKHDRQTFFVILDHFLPFYPPKNLKNRNFEKNEKKPRALIILHMCTISNNHMMYDSGDNECNKRNFCHFGPFFAFSRP